MRGSRRRSVALVAAACVWLSACWSLSTPTPILQGTNMADPGVIYGNGAYHVFATNWGYFRIPHYSATSITSGSWSALSEALPTVPAWALGNYWGPEVVKKGSTYYLFYAATIAWDGSPFGEHAIGVAQSPNPGGPFKPIGSVPVYRDPSHNGVIDPDVVYDYNGNYYLLWSVDWGRGGRYSSVTRKIQGCRLNSSMTACATGVTTLLNADRNTWEAGTVEAPSLVLGGDGKYNLFYSGGNFEGADGKNYGEGYAICGTTPLSACAKQGTSPWVGEGWNGLHNPGGADLIPFYYGIYAAVGHTDMGGGRREPRVVYVSWTE